MKKENLSNKCFIFQNDEVGFGFIVEFYMEYRYFGNVLYLVIIVCLFYH